MIERYRVSFAYLVPPMLVVLAGHPAVDQYDLSSLEYMLCGGAPLGAQLIKQVSGVSPYAILQDDTDARVQVKTRLTSQRAPGARSELDSAVYGSTETSTGVTILDLADADRKAGSVGSLVPNLEVRLVVCVSVDGAGASSTANLDAEPGQPGELWVRGPTIMKGYLRNARATEEALTPDGWFKTGDVLTRDEEGFFFVVDRVKELIKYKAFQVPPAELEAVLLTHPDIADAAVIGVESVEQATELPRAYIVHARPHELKSPSAKEAFSASVREWIKSHVAKHKYLRGGVVLVDAVPKSTSGKILRRELRELAKSDSANGKVQTKL
ncbi:hypothetical protein C8F01DRAFT_1291039 [Mycena amicta]|nr:hypothetical protein C8F01DRAFT_1291039 [Mycena amicta]